MVRITAGNLPAGARVLEGGCGRGNKVAALANAGFEAIGVDFAADSVRQARLDYPGLDIREGDVRALPFTAEFFDGYWSIGVIEHFWEGYDSILAEASRVLRPGGFLFLTAPWLSPYRRSKAGRQGYARRDFASEPHGFLPVRARPRGGLRGARSTWLRSPALARPRAGDFHAGRHGRPEETCAVAILLARLAREARTAAPGLQYLRRLLRTFLHGHRAAMRAHEFRWLAVIRSAFSS